MSGNTRPVGRTGILLVNLGSPDSPSVADVRRYLRQFLMDEYVIDLPFFIRKVIVSGFILPFRPKRSARAYRSIWWEEGSPLIAISRNVHRLLSQRLDMPVELAMRYGNPSIEEGLRALAARCAVPFTVRVIPLYPHYAMSTVRSTVTEVEKVVRKTGLPADLRFAGPFYEETHYIEALVESARGHLEGGYDHLLFSYHGLPLRHLRKTDPTGRHCMATADCCRTPSPAHVTCYRHQVLRTTEMFVARLRIPEEKYSVSFQSRLGRDAWMEPFTVREAVRLAQSGVRKLLVICPAFVSDCLETLEEIGIGVRERFLAAGGKEFGLIPCLNDHPLWIETLRHYCTEGFDTSRPGRSR
jgi:ferrochelatase